MSRVWYPFYVGDYIRKTAHLSLLEHGAYHMLIDHYMATSAPLPNDNAKLYRICRASSPSERKAVLSVVAEFFFKDDEAVRNKKCDSEISKHMEFINSQSAKAKLRHQSGICPDSAGRLPARATTTTTTKEDKKTPQSPLEPQKSLLPDPFDVFFDKFPSQRKGSRGNTISAWVSSLKRATEKEIFDGLETYLRSSSVRDGFAKGAAAWLNDDGWLYKETEKPGIKPATGASRKMSNRGTI